MRRANKDPLSKIIEENLNYKTQSNRIAELLHKEQKSYCAYTDEFLSRTDAKDIEHFNPTIKGTNLDNYDNWFLVKHQWNLEKSTKWNNFQPVMHPTSEDFEERIIYKNGDYILADPLDIEASHLITLLKLDDPALAENRKKYIKRKRQEIVDYHQDAFTYFTTLINEDPCRVLYLRALKEEFNIDIWSMLV